jgi:hypothetical protein
MRVHVLKESGFQPAPRDLDRLVDLAESLAGAWGARAQASTSVGQERALLRLFGVTGVDRAGRPLAGEVVDRYLSGGPRRLASGVALPFAMALVEYELAPQELALDVSSGRIDLALEADLLSHPDRRALAEAEALRLIGAALDRIDANRTARHELLDVLGERPRPWVGTTLLAPAIGDGLLEGVRHVRDGFDVLRVEVPVGRELGARADEDRDAQGGHQPFAGILRAGPDEDASTPSGSQRALARLRQVVDEAAAERRGYVRLATAAPALAAPEQAVVAAFERVDLVEGDVMAEIVSGRVDPDRALADHAFAQRLHARSGAQVVLGAGPLVVLPDLAAGQPSSPATRAGRALALQLLGVALARANGLSAEEVIVGAVPPWLSEERAPAARAAAEVAVRRALFAGHPLMFDEPMALQEQVTLWEFILAGILPAGTALVLRRSSGGPRAGTAAATRMAAGVAVELAGALSGDGLRGTAAEHAGAMIAAARDTLERVAESGWRAVAGDGQGQGRRFGSIDAVAERSESFDPLLSGLAAPA